MKLDFAMWRKALNVIPDVSKDEWERLDLISRWLICTRAAVLIMTFISSALAGLFALRAQAFQVLPWLALTFGLIMAHATNNIFNDFTDFVRGVDKDNYFRTIYGAQPVASGLMTKRQHLTYFAVTGFLSLLAGIYLIAINGWDPVIWALLGLGAFFVLFYTWPLKGLAMGELAVLIVWGPLMIGGGYYVLAHSWDWNVVVASLPYVLGVTTVLFGKHIDKLEIDRARKIYTLPVLIGEKAARYGVLAMMILPTFFKIYPAFLKPKPAEHPADFPDGQGGWPLYFAPMGFLNNRSFGTLFMLGLLMDVALRLIIPNFWR